MERHERANENHHPIFTRTIVLITFFLNFPRLGIQNPPGQFGQDCPDRGRHGDPVILHPRVVHARLDLPAGEAVLRPDANPGCRPQQGADAGGDATGKSLVIRFITSIANIKPCAVLRR